MAMVEAAHEPLNQGGNDQVAVLQGQMFEAISEEMVRLSNQ